MTFERDDLIEGRFRALAAVDEDGDGRVDIALTTGIGTLILMRNTPDGFEQTPLDGIDAVAYSMAWDDLGGDGDLDLVTGSYNAELTQDREFAPLLGGRSGVFVYEATPDGYQRQTLATQAQALALLLEDLDGDGSTDVMVGNDLLTPDAVFLHQDGLWVAAAPFRETTFSTMSLDAADVDNDGDLDVFATDMHPMTDDPATLEAWAPIFEDMEAQPTPEGDPQVMANVLQLNDGDYESSADPFGLTATGWSWSGVFGDLDHDGFSDLYVVNGMAADSLFPDLPDHSLVEENQVFRNEGGNSMTPMPDWGLASEDGGRGMAMADLDADGDLDIVINNLNAPAMVFENQVCGGNSLTLDLRWIGTQNVMAVGSSVTVETSDETLLRTVRTARGYLSSGPTQIHVGLGRSTEAVVTVAWPDGESSIVDARAGEHLRIVRSEG